MELVKSLLNTIVSPSQAFAWVAEHPLWLIPVVLLLLTSVIATFVSAPFIADLSMQRLEEQSSNMSPEQIKQSKDMINSPLMGTITVVFAVIGMIIALLIQTVVFHFSALTIGGNARFGLGFAMVAYAQVPIMLQQIIQSVYSKMTDTMIQSGFSAMLPADQATKPMGIFLTHVDVFTVWSLILIAIGLPIIYKISKAQAAVLSAGYWVLSTTIAVIIGAIGGAFA
ncbi:MAG TPA: YIP1 family protein [Candidatus Aquicultor sp.]